MPKVFNPVHHLKIHPRPGSSEGSTFAKIVPQLGWARIRESRGSFQRDPVGGSGRTGALDGRGDAFASAINTFGCLSDPDLSYICAKCAAIFPVVSHLTDRLNTSESVSERRRWHSSRWVGSLRPRFAVSSLDLVGVAERVVRVGWGDVDAVVEVNLFRHPGIHPDWVAVGLGVCNNG